MDIVLDQLIRFYLNYAINFRPLTPHIMIVMLYPQNGDSFVTIDSVTSLHPVYSVAVFSAAGEKDRPNCECRVIQQESV